MLTFDNPFNRKILAPNNLINTYSDRFYLVGINVFFLSMFAPSEGRGFFSLT